MIHNHQGMEKEKGVDVDHVIIDRGDFEEVLKQSAPRIRVLEQNEILVISSPNRIAAEEATDLLKTASKAKRYVVIHGYQLYIMQKKEQLTVEKKEEESVTVESAAIAKE